MNQGSKGNFPGALKYRTGRHFDIDVGHRPWAPQRSPPPNALTGGRKIVVGDWTAGSAGSRPSPKQRLSETARR